MIWFIWHGIFMIYLHILEVDDFSGVLVYVYTIFWESIQVLRRGDIIAVYEMIFKKLCFCLLTLLFCAPPGFR